MKDADFPADHPRCETHESSVGGEPDVRQALEEYAAQVQTFSGDNREYFAPRAFDALRKVLDLHSAFRIYEECEHNHTDEDVENGIAKEINDVGYVCEDGLMYTVCRECCTGGSGYQSVECVDNHPLPCFPCSTVKDILSALTDSPEDR